MKKKRVLALVFAACLLLSGCTSKDEPARAVGTEQAQVQEESESEEVLRREYNAPGTYSETTEYKEVSISSKDVTLEGVTAEDLIVEASVGEGDVTLQNVTVTGTLMVYGGGPNSIHIEGNSSVEMLIYAKEGTPGRVAIGADASVTSVSVDTEGKIDVAGTVSELIVGQDAVNSVVELKSDGNIGTLNSEAKMKIIGTGKIGTLYTAGNVQVESTVEPGQKTGEGTVTVSGEQAAPTTGTGANKKNGTQNTANNTTANNGANNNTNSGGNSNQNTAPAPNGGGGGQVVVPDIGGGGSSYDTVAIERVESVENGKVKVTLNTALDQALTKGNVSILCTSGGSDMTVLSISTSDNKTYQIETAYYKDNTYEFYMTLPNGKILSKEFVVKTDCPAITATQMVRINDGVAEFYLVSDTQGTIYYMVEETTAVASAALPGKGANVAVSGVGVAVRGITGLIRGISARLGMPTVDVIKQSGTAVEMRGNSNVIRISGLKKDVSYSFYFAAEDMDGKITEVKGPVTINAKPPVQPEASQITITSAVAKENYFNITLSAPTQTALTGADFSISCPAQSKLSIGRAETTDNQNYTVYMQEGYMYKDKNHLTLTITFPDKTVATTTFYADLSAPMITGIQVTRTSDTSAKLAFHADEAGKIYYMSSPIGAKDYAAHPKYNEVMQKGTVIPIRDGNNLIDISVAKGDATVFFVAEDGVGNYQKFAEAGSIVAGVQPPDPNSSITVDSIQTQIEADMLGNDCHALIVTFSAEASIDRDTTTITGNGLVLTGSRDIWMLEPAGGFAEKTHTLTLRCLLTPGTYTFKAQMSDGTYSTKTFTVQ